MCIVEWSREVLLEAWIVDPVKCCEISGIVPPENLNDVTGGDHELNIMTASSANRDFTPTTVSEILRNLLTFAIIVGK